MLSPAKLISGELQFSILRIKARGSKIARILDLSTLCAH